MAPRNNMRSAGHKERYAHRSGRDLSAELIDVAWKYFHAGADTLKPPPAPPVQGSVVRIVFFLP